MKEQAARQQGAALQKGAATEDRQEKTTAQAAASAKYREDGVPQQELERFARFLLPKIQAFYQSEEGQRLFEEWINRRNAEESWRGAGNEKAKERVKFVGHKSHLALVTFFLEMLLLPQIPCIAKISIPKSFPK